MIHWFKFHVYKKICEGTPLYFPLIFFANRLRFIKNQVKFEDNTHSKNHHSNHSNPYQSRLTKTRLDKEKSSSRKQSEELLTT